MAASHTLLALGWARSIDGKTECVAGEDGCGCGIAAGAWVAEAGKRAPQVRQNSESS
jgi:hypothetical protein